MLKFKSQVRLQGKRLGLRDVYLEWLCGDEEGASSTEQGMLLTEAFFEEASKGMKGDTDGRNAG